jgi:hypothetical protein
MCQPCSTLSRGQEGQRLHEMQQGFALRILVLELRLFDLSRLLVRHGRKHARAPTFPSDGASVLQAGRSKKSRALLSHADSFPLRFLPNGWVVVVACAPL